MVFETCSCCCLWDFPCKQLLVADFVLRSGRNNNNETDSQRSFSRQADVGGSSTGHNRHDPLFCSVSLFHVTVYNLLNAHNRAKKTCFGRPRFNGYDALLVIKFKTGLRRFRASSTHEDFPLRTKDRVEECNKKGETVSFISVVVLLLF